MTPDELRQAGVRVLNKRSSQRPRPPSPVTQDEWDGALAPFPKKTRWMAANLAAHNYDVVVVGDRLLIAAASGGAWFDHNGQQTDLTAAERDALYPKVPKPDYADHSPGNLAFIKEYENASPMGDGSRRIADIRLFPLGAHQ